MKKIRKIVQEVESWYGLDKIQYEGYPLWDYLRGYIIDSVRAKVQHEGLRRQKLSGRQLIKMFCSIFWGLSCYFQRYNRVVFSSSERLKVINDMLEDRVAGGLFRLPGKTLLVLSPIPAFYPQRRKLRDDCTTNEALLYLIAAIIGWLCYRPSKIINRGTIEDIARKYQIDLNLDALVCRFIGQKIALKIAVKFWRPEVIYYVNAPGYVAYLAAAHDSGIKTVELQHGIIHYNHPSYLRYLEGDSRLRPQYLLSYGKNDKDFFNPKNTLYICNNNVQICGSYIMDYLNKCFDINEKYTYNNRVCFTSNFHYEDRIIPFLKRVAELNPFICFEFVPRYAYQDYDYACFPPNIIVVRDGFYESIYRCCIHSTMLSTCALESLVIGIPSVLFDIDGLSKGYFEPIIGEMKGVFFATKPEDYKKCVERAMELDIETIKITGSYFFELGFVDKVAKFEASLIGQ
ncbi:MAG TPA: hypothetical protein DDX98_14985 [Bacteroidales bacterium]|jgi:hypothetical protein|nr:hypothetical protein [Bacteroidales bacterium]